MDKKFFMVFIEGENIPTVQYDNLEEAEKKAQKLADKYRRKVFVLESTSLITPDEINVKVDSFEAALEYLGRENNACMCGIPDKHAKVIVAMYKLITIAEAWNKADEFVPDFSNCNQYKYYPSFIYYDNAKKIIFDSVGCTTSFNELNSLFSFKTHERAEQFGKQFIDLWNEFLLN